MTERHVVLGLGHARAGWFDAVARWATVGSLAAEFVKALSVDEVRVRLSSGRPFSALLIDSQVRGFDRDLVATAIDAGAAVMVVDDPGRRDHWKRLGVAAVLPPDLDRTTLATALDEYARRISHTVDVPGLAPMAGPRPIEQRGQLVAVLGTGGSGASSTAIALAQGAAQARPGAGEVVLADLVLDADQAALHAAVDVAPGLSELVDAFRTSTPDTDAVHATTFSVEARGYRLLLGLRRHRDWTALRPRAVRAAVDGLRAAFGLVVCDVDGDLEGEDATGSADIEDRNILARTAVGVADCVVVVGRGDLVGTHALLRRVRAVLDHGVDAQRIVPVVTGIPRRGGARRDVVAAFVDLLGASNPDHGVVSPVLVDDRRRIEAAHHDGSPLPKTVVSPIWTAAARRLASVEEPAPSHDEPVRVVAGSLGAWAEEELAG